MKTNEEISKAKNFIIFSINSQGGMGAVIRGSEALKNATVVWGRNEDGLEHVSVNGNKKDPSWDDMCFIKDIFFDDEEEVVQLHPKKSEYVNLAKHCLHLWRRIDGKSYFD